MKKTQLVAACLLTILFSNAQPTFQWAKSMGGTAEDEGRSLAVDGSGNIYTIGNFGGTADFDPGPGNFTLSTAGNSDVFISKLDASGNLVWAKKIGGSLDDKGESIALDQSGNVYATGSYSGTVDFDPGVGVYNMTSTGDAIFVLKLNASGNFVWAKSMGGAYDTYGISLAIDASGNVYTTGGFNGTADFDPGAGTYTLTADDRDIFISKLDASGNFVWAKSFTGPSLDSGNSITLDGSGNVYTTGYFGLTADFDPGAGTFNLTASGIVDVFISKLDASGNFVWAKSMGSNSYDFGNSLALDAGGNVFSIGLFAGTVDFDPGAGIFTLSSAGNYDVFISKLDVGGNFVWAKRMGGVNPEYDPSLTLDPSGNVYTTGRFQGTVDFDPGAGAFNLTSGGYDIFISKLDASGNFVWAHAMGGSSDDKAYSIKTDASGNIYTTGQYSATADFDPGVGISNLTSVGGSDIFVHKMETPVGLKEITANPLIQIYPNPANDLLFFNFSENEFTKAEIINNLGQLVKTIDLTHLNEKMGVSLKDLPNGVYLLTLRQAKGDRIQTVSKRFVIAR